MTVRSPSRPLHVAHVAVIFDPSPAGLQAADRSALLARQWHVPVRVLWRAPSRGRTDPPHALRTWMAALHSDGLAVEFTAFGADALAQAVAAARGGLLVLPSPKGHPIRELLAGIPAERLVRLVQGPVLVVKRPAPDPYRRVLVPIDLGAQSVALVDMAGAVAPAADLTALHVIAPSAELPLLELDVPASTLRMHRAQRIANAHRAIESVLDAARCGGRARGAVTAGGTVDAIVGATRTAPGPQLVVIGKRGRSLLADFLLGSATRRVLAQAQADVLVVPQAR